jgi:D-apionolactonase
MILEDGDLRYIRYGNVEVLRRLYVALRDVNWGTPPMTVADLRIEHGEGTFTVTYLGWFQQREIDYVARVRIEGEADGTIRFQIHGLSRSTFERNRIGICVLHPAEACAGRPFQARKTDSSMEMSAFPREISPHQPVHDLGRIAHEILPGLTATVQFAGDTFEMEDQRNWTDASYKIYSTPLRLPFPVTVQPGDEVRQSVTLSLATTALMPPLGPWPPELLLQVENSVVGQAPQLGLVASTDGPPLNLPQRDRLRALRLGYLRIDLNPTDLDYSAHLRRAAADAESVGVPLELALHLSPGAEGELSTVERLLRMVRPRVCRWLVFDRTAPALADSPAGRALLQQVRPILTGLEPAAPLVSGTDRNFTELNRSRPPLDLVDGVAYSIAAQVHAFDDSSVIETTAAQRWTVESARRFVGEQALHVGPVTLRPRFNAVAVRSEPTPQPGERGSPIDPRQAALLGAAWTLGSLAALVPSGVSTVTYGETLGWKGVQEHADGSPDPARFPSLPGSVYPLYHILADVAELAGSDVLAVQTGDPLRLAGLALRQDGPGGRTRILLANLTPERQRVPVTGLGSFANEWLARRIDEHTARRALLEPERFRAEPGARRSTRNGRLEIELLPYAVARLDSV